jgi:predicted thioesterase
VGPPAVSIARPRRSAATCARSQPICGLEGKLYRFKVEAFDDAGSIGGGEHVRAIVATERLMAGAAKRKPRAAVR